MGGRAGPLHSLTVWDSIVGPEAGGGRSPPGAQWGRTALPDPAAQDRWLPAVPANPTSRLPRGQTTPGD
jgi:hypothetical protein